MNSRILELAGAKSWHVFKVLTSETRYKILELLASSQMNVHELADVLKLSQPTVTRHTQALEESGLISCEYLSGAQGTQKICSLCYDRLVISFEDVDVLEGNVEETAMPIGLYTLAHASPTCGLASSERIIGLLDNPQAFFHPHRGSAQIIWMADGFVEYVFPNDVVPTAEITRLELSMEICSEAPLYDIDYPSDITVWINSVEIGTWTSSGDFGAKPGRLNPSWWNENWTQHGLLKVWSVHNAGASLDGLPASEITLKDTMVQMMQPIVVRIGVKPDAKHAGGFNLFGRGFGNYQQDLILRLHYSSQRSAKAGVGARGELTEVQRT